MGSQVQQLKASLNGFADATQKAGERLRSQKSDLDRSSQQVLALIGGSATSKDRQVVAAIEQAKKAVEQAGNALNNAARTAKGYASSI